MAETERRIKRGDLALILFSKTRTTRRSTSSTSEGRGRFSPFIRSPGPPVSTDQMRSLEKNRRRFEELNTEPLGISVDSQPCKAAWVEHLGIKRTRLLADFWPHGGLAIALGLFREKHGFSERANVILDENQRVAFIRVYPTSELPDIDEVLSFLKAM